MTDSVRSRQRTEGKTDSLDKEYKEKGGNFSGNTEHYKRVTTSEA